ncbi:MAG: hypothetical protein RRY29_04210 [Desulfovibrionaceae bacterium]
MRATRLYFDKQDRDMLQMINATLVLSLERNTQQGVGTTKERLFDANLHPHGIKDLVISQEFRVAYAVINLLTNLEAGQAADRILALQALYDEVLTSAQTLLRRNTARVLLQIMKDLVRAKGNEFEQLKLAHDFRKATSGTPRIVRKMLARYHLPEMPEDWSQLAFDDHVHDANTKGRKTPTHLIMDAWIKGIRFLTVVYYCAIDHAAAKEIIDAATIMGITVRIGIEFRTPFRGHYVSVIWIPRGFSDSEDFLDFLSDPKVVTLMNRGREGSRWMERQIFHALNYWNTHDRLLVEEQWDCHIPELSDEEFTAFVGTGSPSMVHLAECLHRHVLPALTERGAMLRQHLENAAGIESESLVAMRAELDALNAFGYENIIETWLNPSNNPVLAASHLTVTQDDRPEILSMEPGVLVSWLMNLHSGYRIALNLANLNAIDVLELLWDCQGGITHLEIFNIKDWHEGRLSNIASINELQRVLNEGRGPRIKQLVRHMIRDMRANPDEHARVEKFQVILRNVPILWESYKISPLKSRLGSDSASRTCRNYGMGLVFSATLPPRAQRFLAQDHAHDTKIPLQMRLEEHITYVRSETPRWGEWLSSFLCKLPGCRHVGCDFKHEWIAVSDSARFCKQGNLTNLGGLSVQRDNGLLDKPLKEQEAEKKHPGMNYLSTTTTNALKVLVGLVPSVYSFWYTQEWWFLAWFGTLIWFAITGVRNVLQMVLAGQGLRHSSLLRWKDHVHFSRLCDSLMYTGISVLLLEVVVRVLFLENTLDINVRDNPLLVFTVLNVVNGFYICAHNVYRGFPREAAIGNLFRSAIAIPVSSLCNMLLAQLLLLCGLADPLSILVPSAAIVSKFASDVVAAVIEGYADSQNNLRMRRWDYRSKLKRVFECYTRLELLYPEEDVLIKLARPQGLGKRLNAEAQQLEQALIINALDLMYFWFYQPRAQDAFATILRQMPQADRTVFARSQLVLVREKEISLLFVNDLVGRSFSRPLAFYLGRRQEYIRAMTRLCTPGRRIDPPACVIPHARVPFTTG